MPIYIFTSEECQGWTWRRKKEETEDEAEHTCADTHVQTLRGPCRDAMNRRLQHGCCERTQHPQHGKGGRTMTLLLEKLVR
mmetsp:Transcript_68399/g.142981  ORF Transcript_68399/g.142981 Transcript_68399/m.142981 type:complete len:81 (-) Transcript_68399:1962-2204(-)